MDVLFINPDSSAKAYQGLAKVYSAIEPPTWSLLLAQSCRARGFSVGILDCDAERLTLKDAVSRIQQLKPRLSLMVVYGQNPNSSTTNMIGGLAFANAIKEAAINTKVGFVGPHTSALPLEVLSYDCVDIVFLNEGVYALHDLLSGNLGEDLQYVKGIGYKKRSTSGNFTPALNDPQQIVPQERMDYDLPGYAWDLLPFNKKPLDLYRAHFWHSKFNHNKRTPFAAIYTSLGCNFKCNFCMINIINRVDNSEHVDATHFRCMRFWSPQWVIKEMQKLADFGVETLRICDEMFFLNRKYYLPILKEIVNKNYEFNMWAYSRIDTVRSDDLPLFKKAGVDWLALGIEAGNQTVRQDVSKGLFKEVNIRNICNKVRSEDINIISNYIFGFPEDTTETMQQTLDLALELNTEMVNMYPCQALPGSQLYRMSKNNNVSLPNSFEGYAFLSYESQPLPTKYLTSAEVLKFRDQAWKQYFTSSNYLNLVESRFGLQERKNIQDMSKINLKRKILGD